MNSRCTGCRDAQNAEILIERARSLVPALRQRSAQATAERRLPQETIDDFQRLGLTRCLQPAMFGGFGSDYRVFSKMLRALAQGCGSSAWVCAVHGEHNWVVGNFSEAGAARGVGRQSRTPSRRRASRRTASAETVAGGHRLSGRWGFASGCDHAQWILLGAMVKDRRRAEDRGCFSCRSGQVEIVDDWHVMGLCGTGSKSVVVKDVIVPATRSVSLHELKTGTAPGAAVHPDNPLYRTPRNLLALFSLSSVVVGLAERAVAEFVDVHPRAAVARPARRRSRGRATDGGRSGGAGRDRGAGRRAHHRAQHRAGRVAPGNRPPSRSPGRGAIRPMSTQLAHSAVKLIFEAAGGTALYATNPLQEIFRDITAASAHLSLSWHRAAPYYGQIRLGLPVDFDTL